MGRGWKLPKIWKQKKYNYRYTIEFWRDGVEPRVKGPFKNRKTTRNTCKTLIKNGYKVRVTIDDWFVLISCMDWLRSTSTGRRRPISVFKDVE